MKLVKLYIENFGKLSKFEYSFSDGVNVINEENGWGKSTLATFIKAMFYGLDSTTVRNLDLNERKKYEPWQGGKFGGNLIFKLNDKEYKIERFFGKKATDDTFSLIDLNTNKSYTEASFNNCLGEHLFKINKAGFENSLFLSQTKIEEDKHRKEANGSFSVKLNSDHISEDMAKFNDAIKILDSERQELKKIGNKGKIADLETKIKQINLKINEISQYTANVKDLSNELEKVEKDISLLKEQEGLLDKELSLSGTILEKKVRLENLAKLNEKLKFEKERLDKIERFINGNTFNKEYNQKNYEYEGLLKEKTTEVGKNYFIIAPIIGVLGIIVSLILLNSVLFIPLLVFSLAILVVGTALFSVKFIKNKKITTKNELLLSKRKNLYNDILGYLNGFNFNGTTCLEDAFSEKLDFIQDVFHERENALNTITSLQNEIEEFKKSNNISETDVIPEIDITAKRTELQRVRDLISVKNNQKQSLKFKIEKNSSSLDEVDELLSQKESLSLELETAKKRLFIIEKTQEILSTANENMRGKYLNPLKESMAKYLNLITKNLQNEVSIDTDFNLYVDEFGKRREFNTLSIGYRDLFNFAFRLSLIDALFKDSESPFIVLDDPFVNFDEEKLSLVTNLLTEVSKDYQIIYFICHESRSI
ncbi:MAG: AAA family ATPase [Clostridia bacterium]|nr:AAA family ATPase [Clostridia bacterium]